MRAHRCYVPGLDGTAARVALDEVEAHHVRDVLRAKPGEAVVVFDGAGLARVGQLAEVGKRAVVVNIDGATDDVAPEPPCDVRIVQALLKGEAMDEVVRDVTMIGAASFRGVTSRHAAVPARAMTERVVERWRRVALSSVKQCGRAVVPVIESPGASADEWQHHAAVRLLLVEPRLGTGDVGAEDMAGIAARARRHSLTLAVGPEGGWSDDEVAAARLAGWLAWSLGGRVLRAERAAFAALSILLYAIERHDAT